MEKDDENKRHHKQNAELHVIYAQQLKNLNAFLNILDERVAKDAKIKELGLEGKLKCLQNNTI